MYSCSICEPPKASQWKPTLEAPRSAQDDQEIEAIHGVLDAAKERLSRSRSELNALQLDDRIKEVLSSEQAESPNKISQLLDEHPSRIKHRLKKMIDSGLVSKRGRGKYFLASQVSEMFDE